MANVTFCCACRSRFSLSELPVGIRLEAKARAYRKMGWSSILASARSA